MKNIHLIPTTPNDETAKGFWIEKTRDWCNIYITSSDEEIKEGDWFMSDFNSFPLHNIKELSEREGTLGWKQEDLKNNLKIILTTDQDLNGVQAIDDEFLEWFVKNPSCEWVEVESFVNGNVERIYEIIIPKEEPKQPIKDKK